MNGYIVEDHEPMRIILKRLLKKNFPEFNTVYESENAELALEQIPSLCPDLVLIDISLPGMDGIELIRRLKPKCKNLCMVVVTAHELYIYREAALMAGAQDIISKNDFNQLIGSIRKLLKKKVQPVVVDWPPRPYNRKGEQNCS